MPAIGFGMLWSGYALLFWGWCRIKGYDIGLGEIVVPGQWKGKWPPKLIDDGDSNPMGGPGHNGVPPGDHPGDAPWSYPNGNVPADNGKGKGKGSGSSGGGVMEV